MSEGTVTIDGRLQFVSIDDKQWQCLDKNTAKELGLIYRNLLVGKYYLITVKHAQFCISDLNTISGFMSKLNQKED